MIGRQQLSIASPISLPAVARALMAGARGDVAALSHARELLERRLAADRVLLTDSGTSALALALGLAVTPGSSVALPGYACVDLVAAARQAGVTVQLYDLDPSTLGPDLDSVERVLRGGVSAIVVAHLFGYPADINAVRALAEHTGAVVIEDAAQGSGGRLHGRRLGTLGDLAVMSFGRGKGLCAGGGGALLAYGARWAGMLEGIHLPPGGRGTAGLVKTAVQWALGRPALYALPSALPWLHLGEMVYHAPSEPRSISVGSAALLASAVALEDHDVMMRRGKAAVLERSAAAAPLIGAIRTIPGGEGGFLRYAVRDLSGTRTPSRALGIVRPYPRPMSDMQEVRPILASRELSTPGAAESCRTLFTLPTHGHVTESDLAGMTEWLGAQRRVV